MFEDKIKVSVALCTYNGEAYLRRQLSSILTQSYPIDEIVIVDDCSSDRTVDIINDFIKENEKIRFFKNEYNLRSNLSFSRAISLTSNPFIALCDQDDIWDTHKIEKQIDCIVKAGGDKSEKPFLVYHDLRLMDQNEKPLNSSFWGLHNFKTDNFHYDNLFLFNIVTGCTCLFNQSLKDELLKSDMKDIIMHDYLIALIAYGFGQAIAINEPLMSYRSHSNSVTQKETISLGARFKSFYQRVKQGEYLLPNILQMEKFMSLYSEKLDLAKLEATNRFIGLKNRKLLSRICYKWFN